MNHISIFEKPGPDLVYVSTTASRLQHPQILQTWTHGGMHPEGTTPFTTSAYTTASTLPMEIGRLSSTEPHPVLTRESEARLNKPFCFIQFQCMEHPTIAMPLIPGLHIIESSFLTRCIFSTVHILLALHLWRSSGLPLLCLQEAAWRTGPNLTLVSCRMPGAHHCLHGDRHASVKQDPFVH